ncbi:hypothetical protein [Streptomyces sp. NPDC048419]|uniref:hypothetical protein n=1 Tax=Streptomyces sp. NPDC048419 TaxID=3365547 RepID=UPI0037157E38
MPSPAAGRSLGCSPNSHDRLRDQVRQKEGHAVDPTAAIVDSQSARAAANIPRSTSGWDGEKKVGGRKPHWWWTASAWSRPSR